MGDYYHWVYFPPSTSTFNPSSSQPQRLFSSFVFLVSLAIHLLSFCTITVSLWTNRFSPENTLYEGGLFKAHLTFPVDYPLQPPKMTFKTEIWHPNVYPSGLVCISILHPPEEDKYGYEDAGERWMPVHTPQTILLSVISMVRLFPLGSFAI